MALAELCGMQDFNAFKNDTALENDVLKYTTNFDKNLNLALAPFGNVSFAVCRKL